MPERRPCPKCGRMVETRRPWRFGAGFHCLRCHRTWGGQKFDETGQPIEPTNCPSRKCGSPYWKSWKMTSEQKSKFLSKVARDRAAVKRKEREAGVVHGAVRGVGAER